MRDFVFAATDEEKILQRRVADAVKAARQAGAARCTGFLNTREQQLAQAVLRREKWDGYAFDGGFESAERMMLCVFEDLGDKTFPFCIVEISCCEEAELNHRDYLGALLGLGISRECVGDIHTDARGAQAAVAKSMAALIEQELRQVGRAAVQARIAEGDTAQLQQQERRATASVAAMRLDAVLAAMLGTGRTVAAGMVEQGLVKVNQMVVKKPHYAVQPEDVFSVRGWGKYRMEQPRGRSRKDRIIIEYIQYQ